MKVGCCCMQIGDMAEAAEAEMEAEMRRKLEAEVKLAKSSAAGELSWVHAHILAACNSLQVHTRLPLGFEGSFVC